MKKVFVTRALPGPILAPLAERFEVGVWEGEYPISTKALVAGVADAAGLICMLTDRLDAELLDRAPVLRVVSQMAVGVDNIDVEECTRRGIAVGHTPGVLTETVADTALAILAAVVRRIPEGAREVLDGEWGPWAPFHLVGGDLHDTTIGIVGMGRIGLAVARRAHGFGMRVIYSGPRKHEGAMGDHVDLDLLLSEADHVILCAALTDATRGLIGVEQLRSMKTTAYLVNVARGPLVDTDALVEALDSGEIAGAGLDVTDPEPLPADHALLKLRNCLVVPHIASASVSTRNAMATLAVNNLIAGLDGLPMPARFSGGMVVEPD
ncbi:MAG: D-glycerate dehydrogenase [Acidimicrobiia bacterium]